MDFLLTDGIWIYLFIFFGKILEVSLSTLRIVLVNRGEKLKGSIIALFDITLWILITGTVLQGFQEDIFKVIVFAVAYSIGNYMGAWLDEKLAFGTSSIQVIVPEGEKSCELAETLRENKYAVTIVEGKGKDGLRNVMYLHLSRKRIPKAVEIIKSVVEDAVIIVNDVKSTRGAYFMKK